MELKDVIKNFRAENNISQREFSRRCDLSHSLISLLENGMNPQTGKKMSPDLVTYRKIASGMGIQLQTLFEMLDETELVDLSFSDLERALGIEKNEEEPEEIRVIIRDLGKLTPEQAKSVLRAVFQGTNPDLFKED